MIIWSEGLKYRPKMSVNRLEEQMEYIVDPVSLKRLKKANTLLNIFVPILVFILSKGNLIWYGVSFVLFDIFCLLFSNFCFNKLPYKQYSKLDIVGKQELLNRIKAEIETISDIEAVSKESYYYHSAGYRKCARIRKLLDKKEFLEEIAEGYEKVVSKGLKELKVAELEKNTKKSLEYDNKLEFLRSAQERIAYFDDKYTIVSMKKVSKSLTDLIKILEEKPIGFQFMRTTIMTYIDELLSILEKWQSLDTELQNRYIKDIEKISEELGKNISALSDRIQNMEVQDIDVSISVLLNELNLQNDKEGAENV